MSNNNEKECRPNCNNSSLSWTRRSSDTCAIRERYAQSEGSHLKPNGIEIREALENVLDLNRFRNVTLQVCDNESCSLKEGHDDAMDIRIDIENDLKRLNRLSSKCVKNKYSPEKDKYSQENKPYNNFLLTNEVATNCRIPPNLYK